MYPWLVSISQQLQLRIAKQQLHHGLLFVADQGVGENDLLNLITKTLVCAKQNACGTCKGCMLFEAHSHPDIVIVKSDKPSIGVDLIRSASEFVTTTSQLLGNKIVVIENIERMTEAASNSLLKTLEEPGQNTYLLLTTSKPNQLLATITSRCEKIRLSLPNVDESLIWLREQTKQTVTKEGLMAFSGSPIDYLRSLNINTINYMEFNHDLEQLELGKMSALILAEKYKNDASLILSWAYQRAVSYYKIALEKSAKKSTQSIAYLSPTDLLVAQCQQANKKISQAGINKSLILQQIFNQFKART